MDNNINNNNNYNKNQVAAASSFEPDFVFPLENVTVAQGRDGLYLNKSNKIVIFGIAAVSNRDRYYSDFGSEAQMRQVDIERKEVNGVE